VGEKELAEQTVTLRRLGVESKETMKRNDFVAYIKGAVKMP